ncbi:hypothetical protein DLM78_20030 [Leptospira stimsonii]|uniref:Uncharacterized protein n=1 Tax=Leptospira stimsonii TaxID=2202203 RepID=A0A8B3CKI2_9LEPT|nr:hypothetical protein DLM78_20030 [Leptospira stimsonii]
MQAPSKKYKRNTEIADYSDLSFLFWANSKLRMGLGKEILYRKEYFMVLAGKIPKEIPRDILDRRFRNSEKYK